jgi:hypothetical protein
MTKLLKSHREAITTRLLAATFAERELRLKQQEHALGLRLIEAMYGKEVLRRMAMLPDGWLPLYHKIQFSTGKGTSRYISNYVTLSDPVRLPARHDHYQEAPVDWLAKWTEFDEARIALRKEREQLKTQIAGTLKAFTTVERLAEGWPEGYAHFPHHELAPVALPALRIEDLNARLAAAREAA